jgi:hypothetical protein
MSLLVSVLALVNAFSCSSAIMLAAATPLFFCPGLTRANGLNYLVNERQTNALALVNAF